MHWWLWLMPTGRARVLSLRSNDEWHPLKVLPPVRLSGSIDWNCTSATSAVDATPIAKPASCSKYVSGYHRLLVGDD